MELRSRGLTLFFALLIAAAALSLLPMIQAPMQAAPTSNRGRVTGTVSNAWSGAPLTATVRLGDVYTATATPDYEIWAVAGMYTVEVSAPGYRTETMNVIVWPRQTSTVNAGLAPAQLALDVEQITVVSPVEGTSTYDLVIANDGPLPVDVTLYEMASSAEPSTGNGEELHGAPIFYDGVIDNDDNHLLASNTLSWLLTPSQTDVSWLTVEPSSLTVAPGSSETVVLRFDGAGLEPGTYEAVLALVQNDPQYPVILELPVTLTVTGVEYRLHLPLISRNSAEASLTLPP